MSSSSLKSVIDQAVVKERELDEGEKKRIDDILNENAELLYTANTDHDDDDMYAVVKKKMPPHPLVLVVWFNRKIWSIPLFLDEFMKEHTLVPMEFQLSNVNSVAYV